MPKNQAADLLPALAQNRSPNVVFMLSNPSGLDAWTSALGSERVRQGFVFAAGKRDEHVIRAIRVKTPARADAAQSPLACHRRRNHMSAA